jgi:hypothetical protein
MNSSTPGVITATTGQKALKQPLAAGQIQRIGKGAKGNPYRYFKAQQV